MPAGAQTILVVEDEASIASFVSLYLKNAGYDVRAVSTGGAALTQVAAESPALIILDLMLPDVDGIEICRRIRKTSDVPILMLTARDAVEDKIAGLDTGADDYLVKPFALGELLARARALLRRGPAASPPALTVGDLTLDPATRQARRGDRAISLSVKEYALLEYLMRHAHQTVSRSQIIEHVWDFDFDGVTNVVDVYINYLRNKVDRGREDKLIHTVRGVGYRLGVGDG